MARGEPLIRIRVPQEVKEWIDARARRNIRSISAEAALLLRAAMEAENAADTP